MAKPRCVSWQQPLIMMASIMWTSTCVFASTPLLLPAERAALLPGRTGSWQARGRSGEGGSKMPLDGYDVSQAAAMMVGATLAFHQEMTNIVR
jgi:hypothetical protein